MKKPPPYGPGLLALCAVLSSGTARAQAPSAAPDASAAPAGSGERVWASCVEHLPRGAARPALEAHFPARGLSGYEARLTVVVTHGAGETVLPEGFRWQRDGEAARAIEKASFVIPSEAGGSAPFVDRGDASAAGGKHTTTVSIPFLLLPATPGRHLLTLPPIPIAIARASGEVMTLCTPTRDITVDDPIADEVDPKVRPNPPPRPQREEWTAAKWAVIIGAATLALAALLAWLLVRWRDRPRIEPPKPRVLPWIAALRELDEIRRSELLRAGQHDVFFDRVSDCIRKYLGDRYGFDGLESTSEEIRGLLERVYPPVSERPRIDAFLDDTDLVKFAKVVPRPEDCADIVTRAEQIVHLTTPPALPTLPGALAAEASP
jgi:hypothetical protein